MRNLRKSIWLVLIFSMGSGFWVTAPSSAAASHAISFSNVQDPDDGNCAFTTSFSWTGYAGGSNDSLLFILHIRYTDGTGVHDQQIASRSFASESGRGGQESWTYDTFLGSIGSTPVIAGGDWYGEVLLSSKQNGQGTGRTLVDVTSDPITTYCRVH
jgi:hypothetical protein